MKLWLTKLSVVLITFITLGMYIPPTYLDAEAADQEIQFDDSIKKSSSFPKEIHVSSEEEHTDIYDQFVSYAAEQAKSQSFAKFGPRIANVVGDEFLTAILPKIEEVIRDIAYETTELELLRFEVTEKPAKGYGEKIFHIYDEQTGSDVARFHVRRVNHPREGHSFNFHYHLLKDNFESHHDLGDIYWAKDTPPKWMS